MDALRMNVSSNLQVNFSLARVSTVGAMGINPLLDERKATGLR
jgi:hypothetical protein